jgi:tellurite resistance protein
VEHDSLSERRRALENAYFARHDREVIERRRNEQELLEASGVQNVGLLRHLLELGITADTLEAMAMVPLLFVAWADGRVDDAERVKILEAAKHAGLERGSSAHQVLEAWLAAPPDQDLLDTWADYTAAIASLLPANIRTALRNEVLRVSRDVAEASGGFFGLGNRVSASEQKAIDRIEAAFTSE